MGENCRNRVAFKTPIGDMSVVYSGNFFPTLIPCHRVIRSDNKTGGVGGGPKLKQLLINAKDSRQSLAHMKLIWYILTYETICY